MKRTYVRIVVALVLLGALAVIPASTQVVSTGSSMASEAGVDLPLLLVVNRLELSQAQMETVRATIGGLLDGRSALETQRADFETEMIAFHGTAEELDVRIAAFEQEIATARSALRIRAAAAVDTVKETLTMKQGEILMRALPGLFGRLNVLTTRTIGATPATVTRPVRAAASKVRAATSPRAGVVVTGNNGRVTITTPGADTERAAAGTVESGSMSAGPMGRITFPSGTAGAGSSDSGSAMADGIGAMINRMRDRLAARIGAPAASTPASPCPMGPMMGMQSSAGPEAAATLVMDPSDLEGAGDFGTLTLSLGGRMADVAGRSPGGELRLAHGLERLLRILELKLAAMP